eukprot:1139430-Pelagomonas_calceolata.AAC.1
MAVATPNQSAVLERAWQLQHQIRAQYQSGHGSCNTKSERSVRARGRRSAKALQSHSWLKPTALKAPK